MGCIDASRRQLQSVLKIRGLTVFKKLNLSTNRDLTTLPAGLWSLTGLEELHLQSCGLTALPEGFTSGGGVGARTGLKKLNLSYTAGRTALPAGLCVLVGLEELHLGFCGLIALLEGMEGLAGLRKLDLCMNEELTALPAGLGWLRNLVELDIGLCPVLAAMHDMHEREGLPALLAHLAAQGGELAAGEAG
jgi:Leucine-rich repeat (LRR) protein